MSSKPSHKKSKMKIKDRAIISQPLNFVHVQHQGLDLPEPSPPREAIAKQPDNRSSLPPPCPGKVNKLEEGSAASQANLGEEILKSVRLEIRKQFDGILPLLKDIIQKEMGSHVQIQCVLCKRLSDESKDEYRQDEPQNDTGDANYVNVPQDKHVHSSEAHLSNKDAIVTDNNTVITGIDENTKLKGIWFNPTYNRGDDDCIPSIKSQEIKRNTGVGGTDIDGAGEDNLKRPVPQPRGKVNQRHVVPKSPKSHRHGIVGIRLPTGMATRKTDKRECLARALQTHVIEIVDGVVFQESELPDMLTKDGVLTEDECSNIRRISDRKDQIRQLLSLIKGRDLSILEKFLTHIEKHNQSVAESITSRFEQNIRDNVQAPTTCDICKLQSRVNIKYIIDRLWKIPVIEDGLYNEVIHCYKPTGAQNDLWERLIDALNNRQRKKTDDAFAALYEALIRNDYYKHIAKYIAMQVQRDGRLRHTCTRILPLVNDRGSSSSCYSPRSSSNSEARISDGRCSSEILSEDDNETRCKSLFLVRRQTDRLSGIIETVVEEREQITKDVDEACDRPPPLPQKKLKTIISSTDDHEDLQCSHV